MYHDAGARLGIIIILRGKTLVLRHNYTPVVKVRGQGGLQGGSAPCSGLSPPAVDEKSVILCIKCVKFPTPSTPPFPEPPPLSCLRAFTLRYDNQVTDLVISRCYHPVARRLVWSHPRGRTTPCSDVLGTALKGAASLPRRRTRRS